MASGDCVVLNFRIFAPHCSYKTPDNCIVVQICLFESGVGC